MVSIKTVAVFLKCDVKTPRIRTTCSRPVSTGLDPVVRDVRQENLPGASTGRDRRRVTSGRVYETVDADLSTTGVTPP